MNLINPLQVFGTDLCSVQNPSTYIGGEIGAVVKKHDDKVLFNYGIAFPDVYSIGMSNQAIKIIYNGLNKFDDIRCERVFAPETDFEQLLKQKNVPLYTLETGMPLNEVDILGFSIGYELGITGVLSILDNGRIPLLKKDRTESDPIVMAGGVGATNPAAFGVFFDAVFIGEAEGAMFDLIQKLAEMKKAGAKRSDMLAEIKRCPHVWSSDMSKESCGHDIATRAVYADFGKKETIYSYMPLPNIKPVQDHGVVEIMRGCPNGCRFCHAGVYYRPQRVKSRQQIILDVDKLVNDAGYRQISLTSLSSADYPEVGSLLKELNERYKGQNVSFQLPSLKVNSFTLPILDEIGEVRKSGLTFAVETPDEAWQLRLNKEVYAQHLTDLILEAKKRGWNKAKFYFMVGLPFPETEDKTEEKVIVDFLLDIQKKTNIQCNVNVGTFIPKPHTPYQWIRQISPEESDRKLKYIRDNLPRGKFHVGTHDINTSFLEGLVSRGDERAGMVIYNAYQKGCRLDAWEDHLRSDLPLWEQAFAEAGYDVKNEILRERSHDEILPWDTVSLGVSKNYYLKEWSRHEQEVLTPRCMENCDHRCGICNKKQETNLDTDNKSIDVDKLVKKVTKVDRLEYNIPVMYRAVFSFSKNGGGEYFSHLGQLEIFNRAILKSGLSVIYTAGFNPLPRLEFATTLSLGIASEDEIASVVLYDPTDEQEFMDKLNADLPQAIRIKSCFIFPVTNQRRRESLSASLWGNVYDYSFKISEDEVKAFMTSDCVKPFISSDSLCSFEVNGSHVICKLVFQKDRAFRNALEEYFGKKTFEIVQITKLQTLAKPEIMGWTAEINKAYNEKLNAISSHKDMLKVNAQFKVKVLHAEDNKANNDSIPFFELYRRIAAVNAQLIEQRDKTNK